MIDSTLLQNASVLDVQRGTLVPDQAVLIEGIASPECRGLGSFGVRQEPPHVVVG